VQCYSGDRLTSGQNRGHSSLEHEQDQWRNNRVQEWQTNMTWTKVLTAGKLVWALTGDWDSWDSWDSSCSGWSEVWKNQGLVLGRSKAHCTLRHIAYAGRLLSVVAVVVIVSGRTAE
jgi:hypothetical protein